MSESLSNRTVAGNTLPLGGFLQIQNSVMGRETKKIIKKSIVVYIKKARERESAGEKEGWGREKMTENERGKGEREWNLELAMAVVMNLMPGSVTIG